MTLIEQLKMRYDEHLKFHDTTNDDVSKISDALLKAASDGIRSVMLSNVFAERSVRHRPKLLDKFANLGLRVTVVHVTKDNVPCVDYHVWW